MDSASELDRLEAMLALKVIYSELTTTVTSKIKFNLTRKFAESSRTSYIKHQCTDPHGEHRLFSTAKI